MMKTKYRKKYGDNGIIEYLQYEVEVKHWFFWKKKEWHYIWRPYYRKFYGRSSPLNSDLYVNHTTNSLDKFIKDYPYIIKWFKEAEIEQARLEEKARKEEAEYDKNKNKITYIN